MKWNNSKVKIVKTTYACNSIPSMEQECIFTCDRYEKKIFVCCSDQTWVTKLKKCKHFVVEEILVSSDVSNLQMNEDLRILQIKGHLPHNALTLRLKIANIGDSGTNYGVLK